MQDFHCLPVIWALTANNAIVPTLAYPSLTGTVFHTGDWKIDDNPLIGPTIDWAYLRKLGDEGVLAVVGDSTNAVVKGFSESEGRLRESIEQLFSRLSDRDGVIAVTCFASNLARLETIAVAAKKIGRHVSIVGRAITNFVEIAMQVGDVSIYLSGIPSPQPTKLISYYATSAAFLNQS